MPSSSVTAISSSGKQSLNSCSSLIGCKVFCYRPSFLVTYVMSNSDRSSNHLAVLPVTLRRVSRTNTFFVGPWKLLNVLGKTACNASISALPKPKPSRFSPNWYTWSCSQSFSYVGSIWPFTSVCLHRIKPT
nr:hypothetical protein [Nicotiana tabacum]